MAATLLRRASREPGPRNADAPLIEIYFTATRSGFVIRIKIATTSNGKEKTGDSPCRALKSDRQILPSSDPRCNDKCFRLIGRKLRSKATVDGGPEDPRAQISTCGLK
jgi:hypothetical protein